MKDFSADEMKKIYEERRKNLAGFMIENKINVAVFEDSEDHRDANVRYFCGHISDGILIITDDAKATLIPWDINLAQQNAFADKVIPFTNYERDNVRAIKAVLNTLPVKQKQVVEIPTKYSYTLFLRIVDSLSGWDVRCRENGCHDYATALRALKDEYEIACIKEAAKIGDKIIDGIEQRIRKGKIKTETDVALFIESECRKYGCEKTGFDTLAAGPERSFAIHCFPNYTAGQWPGEGLSILDFGVVYKGYTSDTTLTVAKGKLSKKQEELISLVQKAAESALEFYKNGIAVRTAAAKVDEIFAKAKRSMPHGLGHGIGLEIHEFPFVRQRAEPDTQFLPGMIVTLEPGLYDKQLGGVRLENDVLITENGNEVITHSRIIRL
ncbi:Xaa-Pro peptidase family protein [Treponema sp.]|uniref:M24 family metallopeptidase n=1 Tax=Treponema sp. TaxID=166 RepID=UPI00298E549B|nr:Xaa-Pro peptidase family protein [Treponema sp.]MCR5614027.1 Xaa-Pro peptidase family protein [Treponema sp.]